MSKELGARITNAMIDCRMTQKDLCLRTGISETTLSRYILGDREPKLEALSAIAVALHTTSDYLLGIEYDDFDFPRIRRLVARSSPRMSIREKKMLLYCLLDDD